MNLRHLALIFALLALLANSLAAVPAPRTTPVGAIHSGDFKLVEFFENDHVELHNPREDISEKNNLIARMPAKAEELRTQLANWRKRIGAEMPTMKEEAGSVVPDPKKKNAKKKKNRL